MGAEELLKAPQEMFGILGNQVFYHNSEKKRSLNGNSIAYSTFLLLAHAPTCSNS